MNENFDLDNHLPQQIFPLSPLSMLLCHQNSPDETSVLPATMSEGREEGKQSCNLVGVSLQGN